MNTPIATGQFRMKIDDKSRFSIPAELRRKNNGLREFVITPSESGDHLIILPIQKWEEMVAAKMKEVDGDIPDSLRRWLGTAAEVKLDNQGRLRLSDYFAGILNHPKKIVVVGVYNHYELWEAEKWQNFIQAKA